MVTAISVQSIEAREIDGQRLGVATIGDHIVGQVQGDAYGDTFYKANRSPWRLVVDVL